MLSAAVIIDQHNDRMLQRLMLEALDVVFVALLAGLDEEIAQLTRAPVQVQNAPCLVGIVEERHGARERRPLPTSQV